MFEVDPNLWLQSFSSPWLTLAMRAVSSLGYDWFYIALLVGLAFGVRLRPTLGVILAVLLASLAITATKTGFELPRPIHVDARVLVEGAPNHPLVDHGGAGAFLALPTPAAREAVRALPDPDYGFISGHVAAATALCVALLAFFRIRRWLPRLLLCAWPLLMMLSRMYLGRHFLGDVLGGLAAGTLALCLLAPFTALLEPHDLGRLAGLVVVLAVLYRTGFPADEGNAWQRAARVGCVCAVYFAVDAAAGWLGAAAGWAPNDPARLPVAAVATATVFLVGVAASQRLRLFRQPERWRGINESSRA